MTPYQVKHKTQGRTIPVPCGKCPECCKRRTSGWSFRLIQEEKKSESSYFLTLTYDTKHVPITQNGFMGLDKRHLQLFFKRLRKAHEGYGNKPIKYYAVGEYGGETFRPHYHVILFNADINKIQPAWAMGQIHYGEVNGASVGYTLKYISKPKRIPLHRNDDRLPEFSLMSKGLGANYITPAMCRWHTADLDNRMYCNIEGGKKIAMPRYYKDKIYNEQQRKRVAFFQQQKMMKHEDELLQKHGQEIYAQRAEAHQAAFQKMYRKAQEGNKL